MARGYQPTAFLLRKEPERPGKWDLLLAEADAILEMERCQQCGNFRYVCENADPDIQIDLTPHECNIARAQAKASRELKGEAADGITYTHEAYTESRTPLGEFREPFYKEQSAMRELLLKSRRHIPREHPPGHNPDAP